MTNSYPPFFSPLQRTFSTFHASILGDEKGTSSPKADALGVETCSSFGEFFSEVEAAEDAGPSFNSSEVK